MARGYGWCSRARYSSLCISVSRLAVRANSPPQPLATIQLRGWRRRRHDEIDIAVVEFVDERDEAARLIVTRSVERRHVRNDHRLVLARDLDVVAPAAPTRAQRLEVEPHRAGAGADHRDRPALDLDDTTGLRMVLGERGEQRRQARAGVGRARRQVDARLRELAQPVVGSAGDVGHVEVALEQLDGRQEALPLQAVLVQLSRGHVRSRHQRDAAPEQALEQPPEDHGVGDVRYIQLIEAQQARSARQRLRDVLERGALLPDLRQLRVHLVHEAVKVQAPRVRKRQGLEEQVHQPGLAATHPAPQVQARERRTRRSEPGEPARQARAGCAALRNQTSPQIIELRDHRQLCGIAVQVTFIELQAVQLQHARSPGRGRRGSRARRGVAHALQD